MKLEKENIQIHHKTERSADGRHCFSSVHLTIGGRKIGDTDAVSVTGLLISEIDHMVSEVERKRSEQTDAVVAAFPKHNECFDGEKGFLALMDDKNAVLAWRDFETGEISAAIVSFDGYIGQWKAVSQALKKATK